MFRPPAKPPSAAPDIYMDSISVCHIVLFVVIQVDFFDTGIKINIAKSKDDTS